MPYSVDQDWYFPTAGAKTLKDLAFRASLNGLSTGTIPAAHLKKLPRDLLFDFHEIKNDMHIPSVMRLRKMNKANNPTKLIKIDFLSDSNNGGHYYIDEEFGFKRINMIQEVSLHYRANFESPGLRSSTITKLRRFFEDDIKSGKYSAINIIEPPSSHVHPNIPLPTGEDSAPSLAQALSSALKVPISYHTGQPDIIAPTEAINSRLSELKRGNRYYKAGMRTIRANENIRGDGDFTSRSYLVGSEYSRPLLEFFE